MVRARLLPSTGLQFLRLAQVNAATGAWRCCICGGQLYLRAADGVTVKAVGLCRMALWKVPGASGMHRRHMMAPAPAD